MTEAVWVAVVNGIVTIIVVVLARWHSSREHKTTSDKVDHVLSEINGNLSKLKKGDGSP